MPRVKVVNVEVTFPTDDGPVTREGQIVRSGDSVAALVYNDEKDEVILVKQVRLPVGETLEIPAGRIGEDEDPEEAVKREILEETGYEVSEVTKMLEFYASPGYTTEKIHIYMAFVTDEDRVSEGGGVKEEKEYTQVVSLDWEKAWLYYDDGRLNDGKTILSLFAAATQYYQRL